MTAQASAVADPLDAYDPAGGTADPLDKYDPEKARPKSIGDILQRAMKELVAGGVSSVAEIPMGAAALATHGAEKARLAPPGSAQKVRDLAGRLRLSIEKGFGAEPGPSLAKDIGSAAPMLIPAGEAATGAKALLSRLLGGSKAAQAGVDIGASGAANAALGASYGELEGKPGVGAAVGGGAGVAVPVLGKLLAPIFQGGGSRVLEFGSAPTAAMRRGVNPPTLEGFREALEGGFVPFMGGYSAAEKRLGEYLGEKTAIRKQLMDATGKRLNVHGAIAEAKRSISKDISKGVGGLTPSDEAAAMKWFDDYLEQAKRNPNYKNGWLPLSDAMELKTSAGKNSKFVEGQSQEGRPLASETYYRGLNSQIKRRMEGTPEFAQVNDELARLVPVQEAMAHRALTNRISPWEAAALGGHAIALPAAAMTNHPVVAAASSLFPLFELAKHSPGAARILFEMGKLPAAAGRGKTLIPTSAFFRPEDN